MMSQDYKTYKAVIEVSFLADDEEDAEKTIKYQIKRQINTDLISIDEVTLQEVLD